MNTPALTIITPVFNGAKFIKSCLESVIAQRCPEAEHLIIDGNSTDGTMEIVRHYTDRHKHIRWFSEKDRGQSEAMNKGVAAAKGRIIGFLNADDFYEPEIFPHVLKIFENLPEPALVVGNCRLLNELGETTHINKPRKLHVTDILIRGTGNEFPFNPSAYFYHKSLHDRIGPYDETDEYAMDLDFLLRALQTAHVQYVDEVWGNFRLIKGTKTFRAIETKEIRANNMRIMNFYIKKLPWYKRCWVKCVTFLFIRFSLHYYSKRFAACLKDPREAQATIMRRLGIAKR